MRLRDCERQLETHRDRADERLQQERSELEFQIARLQRQLNQATSERSTLAANLRHLGSSSSSSVQAGAGSLAPAWHGAMAGPPRPAPRRLPDESDEEEDQVMNAATASSRERERAGEQVQEGERAREREDVGPSAVRQQHEQEGTVKGGPAQAEEPLEREHVQEEEGEEEYAEEEGATVAAQPEHDASARVAAMPLFGAAEWRGNGDPTLASSIGHQRDQAPAARHPPPRSASPRITRRARQGSPIVNSPLSPVAPPRSAPPPGQAVYRTSGRRSTDADTDTDNDSQLSASLAALLRDVPLPKVSSLDTPDSKTRRAPGANSPHQETRCTANSPRQETRYTRRPQQQAHYAPHHGISPRQEAHSATHHGIIPHQEAHSATHHSDSPQHETHHYAASEDSSGPLQAADEDAASAAAHDNSDDEAYAALARWFPQAHGREREDEREQHTLASSTSPLHAHTDRAAHDVAPARVGSAAQRASAEGLLSASLARRLQDVHLSSRTDSSDAGSGSVGVGTVEESVDDAEAAELLEEIRRLAAEIDPEEF